jgi:hypothetical protein
MSKAGATCSPIKKFGIAKESPFEIHSEKHSFVLSGHDRKPRVLCCFNPGWLSVAPR